MYALNATTGAELWIYDTGTQINSAPAVVDGVVYIGSENYNVYALNATTGAEVWSFATGSQVTAMPAVANGVVYIGSDDNTFYALNAKTGKQVWSYTTGGLFNTGRPSPTALFMSAPTTETYTPSGPIPGLSCGNISPSAMLPHRRPSPMVLCISPRRASATRATTPCTR